MPSSHGLQKYFDAQLKKSSKGDIKKKMDKIQKDIHPSFENSFLSFRERILGIVTENPEVSGVVNEEITSLHNDIRKTNSRTSLRKMAAVIKAVE